MESAELLEAYRRIYLIRQAEEAIAARYREGKMRCPTHLSTGQEAAAVGVCMALKPEDRVFSTHRCHAHYLAKGGNLNAMIAELYGKATGCAGGIGGSMHLIDEPAGFLGTSPVVGSSVAIAVGVALASSLAHTDRRVVSFMGDAALETGQVWESLNAAALWRLPILFVLENNGYSTQTPLDQRQPWMPGWSRVRPLMPSRSVSDFEIKKVYEAAKDSLDALPAFLEITTYRFRTHVGPEYDHQLGLTYRSRQEVETAMERDPMIPCRQRCVELGNERAVAEVEEEQRELVRRAFDAAEVAPWPSNEIL